MDKVEQRFKEGLRAIKDAAIDHLDTHATNLKNDIAQFAESFIRSFDVQIPRDMLELLERGGAVRQYKGQAAGRLSIARLIISQGSFNNNEYQLSPAELGLEDGQKFRLTVIVEPIKEEKTDGSTE